MTTTVNVQAHLSSNKEVHVLVNDKLVEVLEDGQETSLFAYDDRVISIKEVLKENG